MTIIRYDLAWSDEGVPIPVPAAVRYWRVRRFASDTARKPEVIYDATGKPLFLPVDTPLADFRKVVLEPARYRLDGVDDDYQAATDCAPAYVVLNDDASTSSSRDDSRERLLAQLIRSYEHTVANVTAQAAAMMQACAHVLEAADGAGLPRRRGAVVEASPTTIQWHRDDDDTPLVRVIDRAVDTVQPLLKHIVHTKVLGLSAEQSAALLSAAPASTTAAPDFVAHLNAIEQHLTPSEQVTVRGAIAKLSPQQLTDWQARLAPLTPPQAADLVRSQIGHA